MRNRESCWGKARRYIGIFIWLLVPLAVIPVLAGWVGDVSETHFKGEHITGSDYWLFWSGLLGLLILAALIVWKGRKLLPVRVLEQTPSFYQRRVVVVLLSPCYNLEPLSDGSWQVRDERKEDKPKIALLGKTLEQLVEKECGLPQWTWQQPLRAAHYHRVELKKLVLVGSLNGSGKKEQLARANEFFSTYFPGKVAIYGSPSQPGGDYDTRWQADFEDLSGLSNLLHNILRELHKDTARYTDRDIIIDCTGGFKVTSIAAALVTLDRPDLMFQYVGTGENAGQVTGFNVAGHEHISI